MRKRDLLAVGMCLLIGSMMFNGSISMTPPSWDELITMQVNPIESIDHEPIIIDGNADMLLQKSANEWEGTGEFDSPIIIANYRIEFYDEGIYIRNVSLYFIIDNCELIDIELQYYGSTGVKLDYCENGIISNTVIQMKETGILIRFSSDIKVTGTTVHNCSAGISVDGCNNVNINNNNFGHNDFVGVNITESYTCIVYDNTILSIPFFGVMCVVDTNTYLVNNVISSADFENELSEHVGIFSYYSTNFAMHNTTIFDCSTNLEMQHTNGSWIWDCCFLGATEYGVYLHEDTYNVTVVECCILPSGGTTAYDGGEANSWDDPYSEIGNWWSDWSGVGYYYISGPAGSIDHYPNRFSCECGDFNWTTSNTNESWFNEGVEPIVLLISIGSSIIIILVVVLIVKSSKSV